MIQTMQNKIVLFAKQPGKTSFSSLFTIKHALNTNKVGHTGTLDSFAQGLLVVCAGHLTRLAGKITEFDKSYKAVISFGKETDTLECTGKLIRTAPLPTKEAVKEAVKFFTGPYMQKPPAFSAIHVDGKRASDAVRSGQSVDIPARKITVFSSEIKEFLMEEGFVKSVLVDFHVSKGTYIRSLARDIAERCGSAGYLSGLFRTKVGNFCVEDAAGFSLLEEFNIENVLAAENSLRDDVDVSHVENHSCDGENVSRVENSLRDSENVSREENCSQTENDLHAENFSCTSETFSPAKNVTASKKSKPTRKPYVPSQEEISLQKEVLEKSVKMSEELARQCGFGVLHLVQGQENWFYNGGKLSSKMFTTSPFSITENMAAVFSEGEEFLGLLEKDTNGYFKYSFVVH